MKKITAIFAFATVLLFSTCKKDEPVNSNNNPEPKESVIELSTVHGTMYIWLYNETKKHKANFLKLTKEGFYNNTTFHRIVPGFVIQGGDPNSKDSDPHNDGFGGTGYTIPAEIMASLTHVRGAVAAARLGNSQNPQKESSGCQFYIAIDENGTKGLNGEYTVFGYVMKGMEVADDIVKRPTNPNNRPLVDIKMQVKVLEKTKAEIKAEYGYEVK